MEKVGSIVQQAGMTFQRPTARRPSAETIAQGIAAAIIAGVICFLHLVLRYRFPVPWPDETSFITPAFEMARHGTLFVSGLNPDRIVMWMPPGYMLFLAGLFKLFGYSFALVRWASAVCVIGAALLIGHLIRSFAGGRWAVMLHLATVVTFLSPYVLLSANVGRMDALLGFVILASLLAYTSGLPILGGAIVAASATIHFNAIYFTLPYAAYALACLMNWRRPAVQPVELAGAALAGIVLAAYGLFIWRNLAGFTADMAFQFQLKGFVQQRDPSHPLWPVLAACALCLVVIVRQRRIGAASAVALYGLGFVSMAAEGKEVWYDFAAPLGFLLIAIGLADATGLRVARASPAASIASTALCLVCLVATGFRIAPNVKPLLPTRAMLARKLLPESDITRTRKAIGQLAPGNTVELEWIGVQPFFLDALDRAGVRWIYRQHSVIDNRMDRVPERTVICISPDVPASLRFLYQTLPSGRSTGCELVAR